MTHHRLPHILSIALATAATLWACNDEQPGDRVLLSDIVTLTQADAPATFTFQAYEDSPTITLVAPGTQYDSKYQGARMLLRYYIESNEPYTSGEIEVYSASQINDGTLRTVDIDTVSWNATPVYLHSVWRTGQYLNLHIEVVNSASPRRFYLAVDSITAETSCPQLYMVHDVGDAPDSYMLNTYASFDISPVWQLTTCDSVTMHINNSNLTTKTFTFTKQ